ncbi:MAG: hypothetical protein KF788_20910 [Piscinibacter sp.]|nr:hypothetical protein [Piscinibacter sp.]
MPIVDVQVVGGHPEKLAAGAAAAALAEALAAVFAAPGGRVWVRLAALPETLYAENGGTSGPPPAFVNILLADLPPPEVLAAQARSIAEAVGGCLDLPTERVHVEYAPPGRGRIAFGGELRR